MGAVERLFIPPIANAGGINRIKLHNIAISSISKIQHVSSSGRLTIS